MRNDTTPYGYPALTAGERAFVRSEQCLDAGRHCVVPVPKEPTTAQKRRYVVCPGCGEFQEQRGDRHTVYTCPKCPAVFQEPDEQEAPTDPTRRMRYK